MNFRFVLHFFIMALPFFYTEQKPDQAASLFLNEDTSKHIVQVLRMKPGEMLQLTDGLGMLFTCEITDDNRKKCGVKILEKLSSARPQKQICIGISLIKNNARFEWFLEKATEIGVATIIPLICERTEKQVFKYERMKSILVSAMLQSQQVWLPEMGEPQKFKAVISSQQQTLKYIAHCEDELNRVQLATQPAITKGSKLILIGPEGDFTKDEIAAALSNNFIPVALGNTRLRTETAGVVAATLMVNI